MDIRQCSPGRPDKRSLMRGTSLAQKDDAARAATHLDRKRFMIRYREEDGCWLWDSVGANGYGGFYVNGVIMPAHRVSLLWQIGPPPAENMDACHRCPKRLRHCINPAHLYWGTRKQNAGDAYVDAGGTTWQYHGEEHWKVILTEKQVTEIWNGYHFEGRKQATLAQDYGVSESAICHLCGGRSWRRVTALLRQPDLP